MKQLCMFLLLVCGSTLFANEAESTTQEIEAIVPVQIQQESSETDAVILGSVSQDTTKESNWKIVRD